MAYLYQYIPRTGPDPLPDWAYEPVPMPVTATAAPRDFGHLDCCDCTEGELGAHCEGHMENARSLTPEPGCDF